MSQWIRSIAKPSRAWRRLLADGRRRRGSVLIFCVVLVVVLALIGTAMLSSTRIDRFTTQQHSYNTQIELLVEGAKQVAKSELVKDLYSTIVPVPNDPPIYRPLVDQSLPPVPAGGTALTTYDHWDAYHIPDPIGPAPVEPFDAWLASLVPQRMGAAAGDSVFWGAITAPLAAPTFEAPDEPIGPGNAYSVRNYLVPWSKTISYADGTQQIFPALRPINPMTGALGQAILAADADGDGMADALLSRLIPGELNGVAWYVAIRIVDNAAKVNVNTAFSRDRDYDGTGDDLHPERFTRYFTSSIGLAEMLRTWTRSTGAPGSNSLAGLGSEILELNQSRFGKASYPVGIVDASSGAPVGGDPVDDNDSPRSDFAYSSLGDAIYMGLGRRIANPGYAQPGLKWAPFGYGDMTSLASRFTLLRPETSPSSLEDNLPQSLYEFAANGPNGPRAGMQRYAANQVLNWYNDNFNYDSEVLAPAPNPTTFKPLRALLTTHNPVSNFSLQHNMAQTGGDPLSPSGVPAVNKTSDMSGVADLMPDYDANPNNRTIVAKTCVNTAKFGELWRAYWNVMTDQETAVSPPNADPYNGGTPFTTTGAGYFFLTWSGNRFDASDEPLLGDEHPQHMFRSSLRDIRQSLGVFFPPYQQLLLRAAIAAVNTEDLRDPDNVPTQRDITLTAIVDGVPTPVRVSVYGIEKQPFITEVYVVTDTNDTYNGSGNNPKGYIGIELYNPYEEDIDIGGWCFAIIDRRDTVASGESPANRYPNPFGQLGHRGLSYHYIHAGLPGSLDDQPPVPPWRIPANTVVPAQGFLVCDNVMAANDINVDAKTRPQGDPPGTPLAVPNLHWVIRDSNALIGSNKEGRGGELVLLRPVGTALPPASDPPGIENGNLQPVDSFDFTSVQSAERWIEQSGVPGDPTYMSWHYVRSTAPVGAPEQPTWRFVYPGRYNGEQQRRHQGVREELWQPPDLTPPSSYANVRMGESSPDASYKTVHTIQLANDDWPGPNAVPTAPRNQAPFGGFARNGDILKVTYIGSYRVAFDTDRDSVLELNSVTMDSVFGNDTDVHHPTNPTFPHNDELPADETTPAIESREQVGRFVPLRDSAGGYDDLDPDGDFDSLPGTTTNKWRYRWAIDLFDYLTVQAPSNDYLPDVPTWSTSPGYVPQRQPVANASGGAASVDSGGMPGIEDAVPIHGLININTAPAKVLAAVPWLAFGDAWTYDPASEAWSPSPDGEEDNYQLAKALVLWRDGAPRSASLPAGAAANGPFRTLFDLYRVPAFANLQDAIITQAGPTGGPDDIHGDFSPRSPIPGGAPSPDSVRYDFEETYLLLTNVSNLLTTRSDSYTVYVLVQGWRNVGTTTPELVAQRRVAFIQDRSPITPQAPSLPAPVNVPND